MLDYIPAIVYWLMRGRITRMQGKCPLLLHSVLTFSLEYHNSLTQRKEHASKGAG